MEFINVYINAGLLVLALMTFVWLLSLVLKNSSIVDIFWGLGFVMLAWFYFSQTPAGFGGRRLLLSTLVTVWGVRLAFYILWRNWGKAEDFRYRKWREEAGTKWWWLSYVRVFIVQGLIMWVISVPLLAAQISTTPAQLTLLDGLAVVLWGVGFFFEAAGDWQLARFKANPANRGKVMASGVWRYTRHPNYFGDATQWWGFYLLALATWGGFWTIYSPILMTFSLLRVSGVTLLEKTLVSSRQGYLEYIQTTSAFLPWFPKKLP